MGHCRRSTGPHWGGRWRPPPKDRSICRRDTDRSKSWSVPLRQVLRNKLLASKAKTWNHIVVGPSLGESAFTDKKVWASSDPSKYCRNRLTASAPLRFGAAPPTPVLLEALASTCPAKSEPSEDQLAATPPRRCSWPLGGDQRRAWARLAIPRGRTTTCRHGPPDHHLWLRHASALQLKAPADPRDTFDPGPQCLQAGIHHRGQVPGVVEVLAETH